MSKIQEIPVPQKVRLSELIVDISFSGRNQKEITTNAKALAPAVRSKQGWDATQPGAIFIRDGKKHLVRGFTRVAACELEGFREGFFFEVADDPAALRTEAIRSNMGKPISLFEQGRIYCQMRDGTNAGDAKIGEAVLAPMKISDIAKEVGYTVQHVSNCVVIFEETPEIGELVAEGFASNNIVLRAKQLVKDDAKRLQFLKAAIADAKKEGKETATMKNLDAVRPRFAPLRAAIPAKADAPSNSGENSPITEKEKSSISPMQQEQESPRPEGKEPEQPTLAALGAPSENSSNKKSLSSSTKQMLITLINKWGDECGVAMSDDDINALIEALEEAAIPF